MKKVSTLIIGIVIIGSVLVGNWGYQKYFKNDEATLLTFPVVRKDLSEIVRVRGKVATQETFDLEFPFSGRIEKIFVEEGQTVSAGDSLMQLETTNFRLELERLSAQKAQADAAVAAAQATLRQYQSEMEAQQARLEEVKRGTRTEAIQVAITRVENAQKQLADAELEVKNTIQKAETELQTLMQQSMDVLSLSAVTADKILSQYLQDIIYPIRFPSNKTCVLQVTSYAQNEGQIRDTCFEALSSAESIRNLSVQTSHADDQKTIGAIQETKAHLEKIRTLLNESLSVINSASSIKDQVYSITNEQITTFKTNITIGQSEMESMMSQITKAIQDLQNKAVANKSAVDSAQKMLNQAGNNLKSSEAELSLQQAETLPEQIAAQESEVKKALANLSAQEARIQQARADVNAVNAQIKSTQEKIRNATLKAFEDLKVIKLWIKQQEVFREGSPAISLSSLEYKIQADVSELEIGKIQISDQPEVSIFLDAFPEKVFTGRVSLVEEQEIDLEGDKYYRLNVQLDDQTGEIRSGMSADLNISISKKEQVLTIPEIVISRDEGKSFVGVIDESTGATQQVEIRTGISDGESVEVVSGLEEGQTVFISTE